MQVRRALEENLWKNRQDVCFSDDATWMLHRNDMNFPKRAGNTNATGAFSFGYFLLGKQRKVTRQEAK